MKKLVTNPDFIIIGLTILLFVLVMSSCAPGCYSGFCNAFSSVETTEEVCDIN